MRILIVNNTTIPVHLYGGTERVIWALGKELTHLGHQVTYLVSKGSYCDFAKVIHLDENRPLVTQITSDYDVVHFHFKPEHIEGLNIPYLVTMHGNATHQDALERNTVFVSRNHAERYGSSCFVHNGLDWDAYMSPDFKRKREYFHFLGNAAWRVKNVQGAIDLITATDNERLKVLGGYRFNLNMGFRFTLSPRVRFYGMVGGNAKFHLLNGSKGLIFPVRWHEPFGLAIIESLFYGCPVFGTPYGSLPELVTGQVGFLSPKKEVLRDAILASEKFSSLLCHEYARDHFNSKKMALEYVKKYELVASHALLNPLPPKLQDVQETKFLAWN